VDIFGLVPSFGNMLFTVGAFVLALSIIVAVHEFGHYIVGRWSGIHAEIFSLGFGPVLLSRVDRHGTRWQLSALPFGGYVKFLGDANAASGADAAVLNQLDEETLRRTMHGAPLWARAATVAAGPVFNFILAIIVFAGVLFFRGEAINPPTIGTLKTMPAGVMELMPGDEITAIGGQPTPDYAALYQAIAALPPKAAVDYTIRRDGTQQVVQGPYPFPPVIDALQPGSAAMDAGLKIGDVILSVDGRPVTAFHELQEIVRASGGAEMQMRIWRDGEVLEVAMAPRRVDLPLPDGGFETRLLIGMTGGLLFTPETVTPGVFASFKAGAQQVVYISRSSLSGIYHMVTGAISSCNLRGPLGIAETSGAMASQGTQSFIWFIAVLSTAVGLMNLFPIPVLDGGHLVFHAYEAVVGKPPSERVLSVFMSLGLAVILTFMVFALGNDILCP
jgi:regulator of sigma E protease